MAYVPSNNLPTVNWITQALACGKEEMGELLVGNFNTYLENSRGQQ